MAKSPNGSIRTQTGPGLVPRPAASASAPMKVTPNAGDAMNAYLYVDGCSLRHASYRTRNVFTGFRFSPALMAPGPRSAPGCATLMYIEYLPLLWKSPFVSVASAIRMYATCAVLPSHGLAGVDPSVGGGGHVQRLSPPDASAASIAAIT